jgi:hypothetical protein
MVQGSREESEPFCPLSKGMAFNGLVQLEKEGCVVMFSGFNNLYFFIICHWHQLLEESKSVTIDQREASALQSLAWYEKISTIL